MALKQNIIYIYFKGKHQVTSKSQYQYNHGQYLYFADLNLPQAFEVHFSNKDKGESKTQIGSDNLVEIPDEYFWNGALQIYAWIYLHSKTTDGETIYEVRIPLTKRAKPTDEEPLPVQQSTIDRAIAELNNAVDITTENANKTDSDKIIVSNIKEDVITLKENIDSTAITINQKAQETIDASERAETSAQNAATSENKALDYSQQAEQSAQSALESKNIAQQKSEVATNASNEALGYRDEALEAKNQAVQAKQNIVDYRDETKGYRDETLNLKNNVQTLKGQVEETAEEVESISNTVKEDAQSANQFASSASQSASSANQFANNASQSANSASQSANQAEQYKNQSETNVTHYPKIVDGYWYVWDAGNEEYVNTNVEASGEDGISPTVTITNNETQGTHFIKITDKDGYKTATINDGLTVVMSPSSFVIPTDENGILINNVPLKVTFKAYRAKTSLTLSITNAETITLINPYATEIKGVVWGKTTASTEPYVTATLSSGYKLQGGDSGKFEFTVKVDDKSIILNSTWALAKRGEHGESGVYMGSEEPTDEDVNLWVDTNGSPTGIINDVQVNGTSIVENGVADVPIMSVNNVGVAKIGSGFTMNDGALFIASATESQVKTGTAVYRPLVPYNQHESVFYGLAKVAGHDEKDSSLALGSYTEDAKIAIQKMLGIYEAPWELIREDTFTNAETAEYVINTDANGEAFELTELVFLFETPMQTTESALGSYGAIYAHFNVGTAKKVECGVWTQAANASAHGCGMMVKRDGNLIEMSRISNTTNANTGVIGARYGEGFKGIQSASDRFICSVDSTSYVTKIRLASVLGTGHYKLYGKRKWQ